MKAFIPAVALSLVFALSCNQTKMRGGSPSVAAQPKNGDVVPGTETTDIKPGPGPAGDPVPSPDPTPTPVIPEDGVAVERVGVNFEDSQENGNKDFNDAVLCFEGAFVVVKDKAEIYSSKSQTIKPFTFAAGSCKHEMKIEIVRAGATQFEKKISPNDHKYGPQEDLELKFEKGDVLKVTMIPKKADCADGKVRDLTDPRFVELALNVCRNTGN